MLPPEDADEEEKHRDQPRDAHHPHDLVLGTPAPIFGGDLNRTEPIDGDQEDCVLGYQTYGVVYREPEVTEERSEVPIAGEDVDTVERHRDGA